MFYSICDSTVRERGPERVMLPRRSSPSLRPFACLPAKASLRYEKPPAVRMGDRGSQGTREASLGAYIPRLAHQGVQTRQVGNSKP